MSKHARVALRDVRSVFRVLHEAQELGEPYAARRHMTFELCRLVDARQAYYVGFNGFTPRDPVTVRDMIIGGWPDHRMLEYWRQWGTRRMLREDPLVDLSTHLPGPLVARRRCEVASEQQWESSIAYEAFAEPGKVGDIIVCFYRHQEPTRATGFAIHRTAGDRAFTTRERQLIAVFNRELYRLYCLGKFDAESADGGHSPLLSPRQRQVLEALLRGASVKDLAHPRAAAQPPHCRGARQGGVRQVRRDHALRADGGVRAGVSVRPHSRDGQIDRAP